MGLFGFGGGKKREAVRVPDSAEEFRKHGMRCWERLSKDEKMAAFKWAIEVSSAYSSVLETHNRMYESISVLPYPQNDIMLAICIRLIGSYAKSDRKMFEALKVTYHSLSSFINISTIDADSLLMNNLKPGRENDIMEDAATISQQSETMEYWSSMSESKDEELQKFHDYFFKL